MSITGDGARPFDKISSNSRGSNEMSIMFTYLSQLDFHLTENCLVIVSTEWLITNL